MADYLVTGEFNHHSSRLVDRSWRFEIWNMKQHPLEKHIFKYSRTTMLTTDWSVVLIVLIIAFGTWIIYTGDVTGGVLFISIGWPVRSAVHQRQVDAFTSVRGR